MLPECCTRKLDTAYTIPGLSGHDSVSTYSRPVPVPVPVTAVPVAAVPIAPALILCCLFCNESCYMQQWCRTGRNRSRNQPVESTWMVTDPWGAVPIHDHGRPG